MDAYGAARLAAQDAESAIVARICEDFNLTPVLARAHYEQMAVVRCDRRSGHGSHGGRPRLGRTVTR